MFLGETHLRDSYLVVAICQAPLPGPENTVVKVRGLPSGKDRHIRSRPASRTRANLQEDSKEKVTNVAQGQGSTKEMTLNG